MNNVFLPWFCESIWVLARYHTNTKISHTNRTPNVTHSCVFFPSRKHYHIAWRIPPAASNSFNFSNFIEHKSVHKPVLFQWRIVCLQRTQHAPRDLLQRWRVPVCCPQIYGCNPVTTVSYGITYHRSARQGGGWKWELDIMPLIH